jgi:hypothetical protein
MGYTPPKFGVGGVGCEVWRTKCSESHGKGKLGGEGGERVGKREREI